MQIVNSKAYLILLIKINDGIKINKDCLALFMVLFILINYKMDMFSYLYSNHKTFVFRDTHTLTLNS